MHTELLLLVHTYKGLSGNTEFIGLLHVSPRNKCCIVWLFMWGNKFVYIWNSTTYAWVGDGSWSTMLSCKLQKMLPTTTWDIHWKFAGTIIVIANRGSWDIPAKMHRHVYRAKIWLTSGIGVNEPKNRQLTFAKGYTEYIKIVWTNCDDKVSSLGKPFIDLCAPRGLRMLNGRRGDSRFPSILQVQWVQFNFCRYYIG